MRTALFISSRLAFRSRIVTVSIAISYLVMIIASSVSSGFREEIRSGLSDICGDIQLTSLRSDIMDETRPIDGKSAFLDSLAVTDGVDNVVPVVYRAGIIKGKEDIHGVIFKGVPSSDSVSLGVSIPRRLAQLGNYEVGGKIRAYFIGERVKVRNFTVTSVYDPLIQADDKLVVYADISDMQRLNGWNEDQVSSMEVIMEPSWRNEASLSEAASVIGNLAYEHSDRNGGAVIAQSAMDRYPQLFDWLSLIDFNVLFILVLMVIVAGFNMISGLLILLFENVSTIGMFKAIGMRDRTIAQVFLASSASLVLKGMAAGNLIALLFCWIQRATHFLKLDPENYFVSFVPVRIDWPMVIGTDIISFIVIMLLLLLPCMFISKVDPAETVRVK